MSDEREPLKSAVARVVKTASELTLTRIETRILEMKNKLPPTRSNSRLDELVEESRDTLDDVLKEIEKMRGEL